MWVSNKIFYNRIKIYKKNLFGKTIKKGYILTKPLRYKWSKDIFLVLPKGYVWDGPSYMAWLGPLVGKKDMEALLAASAFHDTADKIPARLISLGKITHINLNIKKGAKLYRKMMLQWLNEDEKPKRWQSKLQYYGLLIFQPIYNIFNKNNNWEIYDN